MSNTLADPSFGLNNQALAILALLSQKEPDFADYEAGHYQIEIKTYPWYNGRERGVALVVQRNSGNSDAFVVFGEHRISDGIFVDHWTMPTPPNGPTVHDFPEVRYQERTSFRRVLLL